jgi:hypothetical protein
MKASFVAYDCRELHKKSKLKTIKIEYIRGCPKWPTIQIWSLEILGVKELGISRVSKSHYL